jgi:hypothetical protein
MTTPTPSLAAAVTNAVEFTKRYPIITVRLFEVRKAGTGFVLAFEPFVVGEPEQGKKGLIYTPMGTIKAGVVSA